jgi:hypothetical protein
MSGAPSKESPLKRLANLSCPNVLLLGGGFIAHDVGVWLVTRADWNFLSWQYWIVALPISNIGVFAIVRALTEPNQPETAREPK